MCGQHTSCHVTHLAHIHARHTLSLIYVYLHLLFFPPSPHHYPLLSSVSPLVAIFSHVAILFICGKCTFKFACVCVCVCVCVFLWCITLCINVTHIYCSYHQRENILLSFSFSLSSFSLSFSNSSFLSICCSHQHERKARQHHSLSHLPLHHTLQSNKGTVYVVE